MNWQKYLKGNLRINECLAKHTSFRIGGPAQSLIEPKDISDLQNVVRADEEKKTEPAMRKDLINSFPKESGDALEVPAIFE